MSGPPPLRSVSNHPLQTCDDPTENVAPPIRAFSEPLLPRPSCDALSRDLASPAASGSAGLRASETTPGGVSPPTLSSAAVLYLKLQELRALAAPLPTPIPSINCPHPPSPSSSDSDYTWQSWMNNAHPPMSWIQEHYPADQHPHIAAVSLE